jgi:hypothetical protein
MPCHADLLDNESILAVLLIGCKRRALAPPTQVLAIQVSIRHTGGKEALTVIRFDSLPGDMQALISDFVEVDCDNIPALLPTREVRIADIPVVKLCEFDRGTEYARELNPDNAPPLVIADNHFLDGKHRCFSFRELGVESFIAIDLTGIATPHMIDMNSMGELTNQTFALAAPVKPKRPLETSPSVPEMF